MRTIDQLHDEAQAIIADAPATALQLFAGELADVVEATSGIVAELPPLNPIRVIHSQYGYAKNHPPNLPLTIAAKRLLELTKLLRPELAELPR